jgi:hypothetical protein
MTIAVLVGLLAVAACLWVGLIEPDPRFATVGVLLLAFLILWSVGPLPRKHTPAAEPLRRSLTAAESVTPPRLTAPIFRFADDHGCRRVLICEDMP